MEIESEERKQDEKNLTDLTVAEEQADSTKGGAEVVPSRGKGAAIGLIVGGAGGAGSL